MDTWKSDTLGKIIEQKGRCKDIECFDCPFFYNSFSKGFNCCGRSTDKNAKARMSWLGEHCYLDTPPAAEGIDAVLSSLGELLKYKNLRYGNSALEPLGIFSKNDAGNSICVRLDDKLSRIKNGTELRKNDVSDLMGYLTLLCIDKGWTDFKEFQD